MLDIGQCDEKIHCLRDKMDVALTQHEETSPPVSILDQPMLHPCCV